MLQRITLTLLTLLLATALLPAQGRVHVVDQAGGPGFDYFNIQPAINAAAEGDTILVRRGTYSAIHVSGKSLVIVGDAPALNNVLGESRITSLAADQFVVVRGIRFFDANPNLSLEDNDGAIWIDDVEVTAQVGSATPEPAALLVSSCADVVIRRCNVGQVAWASGGAFDALEVNASNVHLFESSLYGGGRTYSYVGAGLRVLSGSVFLSACVVEGGLGEDTCCGGSPRDGGPGVILEGGFLGTLDANIQGGTGGYDACCYSAGADGPPILQSAGTLQSYAGHARGLSIDSPIREGNTAVFTLEGEPGDIGFLYLSFRSDPLFVPAFTGVVTLGAPVFGFPAGALSGTPATALVSILVPNLPPPIQGWQVYAQPLFVNGTTSGTPLMLGAPSAVTLLDPSF